MKILEVRTATQALDLRGASHKRRLVGHAVVFDSPTVIGRNFREQISRGAFTDSIARNDVRAFFNHDYGAVLGRLSAGTLRLSQDQRGLLAEIDLPDTTLGRDLLKQVERGDISGMSFGFHVLDENWVDDADLPMRTILNVDLIEVSTLTLPFVSLNCPPQRKRCGCT
jgi:HK97 family phage prohead protease